MINWSTEQRKVRDLIPYEKNPRKISEEQQKHLSESLQKFNLVEIPAITRDNIILVGHQRVRVLALLGRMDDVIDVRVPDRDMTKEEVEEYNLRSNKNGGEFDFSLLKGFDESLLADIGFSSEELDKIFPVELSGEDDNAPAPREHTDIVPGDVIRLGEHRLLCGDATLIDSYDKLMDGVKASMVFTDPPYNVGYTGGMSGNNFKTKRHALLNDKMSSDKFYQY